MTYPKEFYLVKVYHVKRNGYEKYISGSSGKTLQEACKNYTKHMKDLRRWWTKTSRRQYDD